MNPYGPIAAILQSAESSTAPAYSTTDEIIHLSVQKDVYVVSDLHIARGQGPGGCYSGTENFFFDQEFARFLLSLHRKETEHNKVLVINGDFIDFLRITEVPENPDDVREWQSVLQYLGIEKTESDLQASVSKKEVTYGLKTHDYKSVWKLMLSSAGHPNIFNALAQWIANGNELIILKGNHDLEWIWPAVRNALRLILAKLIDEHHLSKTLTDTVLPRVTFIDKSLIIDNEIFIEHGHLYDKFSQVQPIGADILENGEELNIPFGSFFNRYLINKVELVYPYLDNVRPRAKLLPMLMKEHLPVAIKVLFCYIIFLVRVIPKRYYFAMYAQTAVFAILFLAPLGFIGYEIFRTIQPYLPGLQQQASSSELTATLYKQATNMLLSVGSLAVSYLLARVVSYFELDEPSSLADAARERMKNYPSLKYFTFGHTHNPEQFVNENNQWFYNTGTWIPVVEASSAELREDKTFTLLRFRKNAFAMFDRPLLERWNDNAGRIEQLILTTDKQPKAPKKRPARRKLRWSFAKI